MVHRIPLKVDDNSKGKSCDIRVFPNHNEPEKDHNDKQELKKLLIRYDVEP
jgi:hypothetical protein